MSILDQVYATKLYCQVAWEHLEWYIYAIWFDMLLQLHVTTYRRIFLPSQLHALWHDLLPANGHAAANYSYSQLLLSLRQHAFRNKLPGIVIHSDRNLLLFRRENALRLSMYYTDSLCDSQLLLSKRQHAFRNILLSASGRGDG